MRAVFAVLALAGTARAGGLTLPVQGVRSLARAGAFIAGADDADALWQNPAGLAHAAGNGKRALLFDLALVYQPVDYQAPDGSTTSNQQPSQPVPALAGSLGVGDRLVIGGGIATPYMALHRYGADTAARYASVSWTGTTFVLVNVGVAYLVSDRLRVGATLQNQFSKLSTSVIASGCPPMTTCAADDRSFDMQLDVSQTDYFSPSAAAGVQYDAGITTLGLAIQGPRKVSASGSLTAKLPSSTAFQNGRVAGDDETMAFTLPAAIRAGVEVRPLPVLRIEGALDVELWSMHDEITIAPHGVQIENVAGGPFPFSKMTIARDYHTSFAPSLGLEYKADRFALAAGFAYETAAAPAKTVSVLTVDAPKQIVAIGGGYDEDGWQIGGAIAYVHASDVTVNDPAVQQLQPLRDPVDTRINAGSYSTSTLIGGVRFARRW